MREKTAGLIFALQSLAYPIKELAKNFFYANYVAADCGGCMSFLVPLTRNLRPSALDDAMGAVGLAVLSNIHLHPTTGFQGRECYITALSQTNHALRDPVNTKKDEVLAAVVLLAMYENVTCNDASSLDRWIRHLDGATRIIEIRGEKQLDTKEGLALFDFLRAQISTCMLFQERYSPTIIRRLTEVAKQRRPRGDRLVDCLSDAVTRLVDFVATLKRGPVLQTDAVVRQAMSLDAEFSSLLLDIPPLWTIATVELPQPDGGRTAQALWGSYYHVYQSVAASAMWNNYRSARLLIHELVFNKTRDTLSVNGACQSQPRVVMSQCQQTSAQLIDGILASVPFHFGAIGLDRLHSTEDKVALGCPMMLIWPLLVAANSGFASESHRRWISSCLGRIGHTTGFNQALAMEKLLKEGSALRSYLPDSSFRRSDDNSTVSAGFCKPD
ncbi:sequence-specific DNA binding RNA polymerase II transcription factor [Ascochyta rabiei]|uniref:Sequence-specific DNA binding RNA polymerase II transcription factor n=1 Tax=Didymella rabiei TaxID=5454 RepID=A0A163GZX5_DIDRA|nr:sequence-specific DNA binding RNA polymerase II transcription factor [Ascochyta rabiei]